MALEPRVERAEAIPFRIPLDSGHHEGVLLIVHGDGLCGMGEAPALAARGQDLAAVHRQLVSWCEDGQKGPLGPAAACAVETAQLDLRSRCLGRPLVDLLGGARRRAVECNAIVRAVAPAAVAREVDWLAAAGFRVFKLKTADYGGALDLERLGAARWAAGLAAELRIDFNGRLTLPEAQVAVASLKPAGPALLEQPLMDSAPVTAWRTLAAGSATTLAADESLANPREAEELAAAGITLAAKIATVGGISAVLDLASRATGQVLVASSFETSVGLAGALHLACALPADPLACGLATAHLLEGDLASGLKEPDPWLQLPAGPGLGVELELARVSRYRLDR